MTFPEYPEFDEPPDAQALEIAGRADKDLYARDPDGAIVLMEQAAGMAPDNPHILGMLGAYYIGADRLEEAVPVLTRAYPLSPEDPHIARNLGTTLSCLGRYEEAVPYLQQACFLQPDDAELLRTLSYCQWKAGLAEDAVETIEDALATHADDGDFVFVGAVFFYEYGNSVRAMALAQKAAALFRSENDPSLDQVVGDLIADIRASTRTPVQAPVPDISSQVG